MKHSSLRALLDSGDHKEIACQFKMLNKVSNDFQDFLWEKYGEDGYAELLAEWLCWQRGKKNESIRTHTGTL